ncbi:hypothetical protein [Olleya marilimosa]|uniref:hypothetical protein n=1 Tax=Olleya marilimosa TaxID=272164 RepID=UPI0030ECC590|tara:strand:- start:94101 stop:94427 length:327 start_codon:yes stop_codon:yes gene_type:complete
MIITKKLRPGLYEVSGNLVGIKLFNSNFTSDELESQINEDLKLLPSIVKVDLSVDLEDYQDKRTYSDCVIMNIEMLIQFNKKDNQETLELIKNYLQKIYISPVVTKIN